ncbi:hypothetical protein HY992_02945 [Candidatus Micrarchaeota archaeon]|nr:hypothetical protein [Candidatus Micrarchaeota archaeon]
MELGGKPSSERQRLEVEVARTDKEIDELVYQLYGITEKEKKVIEESFK